MIHARRILGIVLFLCLSTIAGPADHRVAAQDKPVGERKAEPRKAADHATDSEDKTQTDGKVLAGKDAVVWPGMTRTGRGRPS